MTVAGGRERAREALEWCAWIAALGALTAAMVAARASLDKAHVALVYLLVVLQVVTQVFMTFSLLSVLLLPTMDPSLVKKYLNSTFLSVDQMIPRLFFVNLTNSRLLLVQVIPLLPI